MFDREVLSKTKTLHADYSTPAFLSTMSWIGKDEVDSISKDGDGDGDGDHNGAATAATIKDPTATKPELWNEGEDGIW